MARDDIAYGNGKDLKSEYSIEGGTMKLMCIILSFMVLLTGCYSSTTTTITITKDFSLPPTGEATFILKDGRRIVSSDFSRVENGYKVVGKLIFNEAKRDFSGIILDSEIGTATTGVTYERFDYLRTGIWVAVVVGLLVGMHNATWRVL